MRLRWSLNDAARPVVLVLVLRFDGYVSERGGQSRVQEPTPTEYGCQDEAISDGPEFEDEDEDEDE